MTDLRAAIAVVHYGEVAPTLSCVASVVEDRSGVKRRVAVVDNQGNLDPNALPQGVVVLNRPNNPGFGGGINAGLEALTAEGDFGFFVALNNDARVGSGFLDAAAAALEAGIGAAGGPIRDAETGRLWYAGGDINLLTGTVRQQRSAAAAAEARDVGFIPATAMAISRPAWREIGGFDPRFFLYNEDLDLCLRLRRAGWRLRFEPGMACEHSLGGSTGSAERSPLYLEHITRTRLLPFPNPFHRAYLAAAHTFYNAIRLVGLAARHRARSGPYLAAVARGHAAALRTLLGQH